MLDWSVIVPIHDLFSNRNSPSPVELVYDNLPMPLRLSCLTILKEGMGRLSSLLNTVDSILKREHPVPSFPWVDFDAVLNPDRDMDSRFTRRCLLEGNFAEAMDAIEAGAVAINAEMRKLSKNERLAVQAILAPDDAIAEINGRFMQHGVGYQFSVEQGRFVRVDSTFMHAEVTEPAMALLTEKGFEGAAQEFQKAHEHYRQMMQDPEAGKDAIACARRQLRLPVDDNYTSPSVVVEPSSLPVVVVGSARFLASSVR